MRNLIKASIVAAAITTCLVVSVLAAEQTATAPACATDESFHPDEVFYVKQCVKLRRDGTCVRYRVITCNGGRK